MLRVCIWAQQLTVHMYRYDVNSLLNFWPYCSISTIGAEVLRSCKALEIVLPSSLSDPAAGVSARFFRLWLRHEGSSCKLWVWQQRGNEVCMITILSDRPLVGSPLGAGLCVCLSVDL